MEEAILKIACQPQFLVLIFNFCLSCIATILLHFVYNIALTKFVQIVYNECFDRYFNSINQR